jgi:hypothetical protein
VPPVVDRVYTGAAEKTPITGSMTPTVPGSGQTFTVTSDAGWPSSGKFEVVIDRDLDSEEHILVNSRSGTTFTVGQRGYDNTTGQDHDPGAFCELILAAASVQKFVNHIDGIEANPHDGVLLDTADHAAISHTSAMIGTDQITATHIAPSAVGASEIATDAVGSDEIAALAVGTGEIAALAVTEAKIADLAVATGKLANDAVTAAKLANASVDDAALVAERALWVVKATAPTPAAHMLWMNTTKNCLLKRNAANTAWEVAFTFGPGVNYTPSNGGIAEGADGQNYARYQRFGRYVIINGFFRLAGAGASIAGNIDVGLPPNAPVANLDAEFANEFFFHAAARASDQSALGAYAAVGVLSTAPPGSPARFGFFATAGSAAWGPTVPFTWNAADNDRFSWFAEYESSTATDANFE